MPVSKTYIFIESRSYAEKVYKNMERITYYWNCLQIQIHQPERIESAYKINMP